MAMPVIAIRPQPGLDATIAAGARLGLAITGFPLSRIEGRGWTLPDPAGIDGLLIGSANAIRHAGDRIDALRHLPVLAVGQATADAARGARLSVEAVGEGGLQALINTLDPARPRHLLRLAGSDHIALQLPATIKVTTTLVYAVCHCPVPPALADLLKRQCLVLLHSAGAAAHLASQCEQLHLDRANITLLAMGPRVSAAAGRGWRAAHAIPRPDEAALLAQACDICKG